jgi:2-hydroxy-3-oxopropionate reductase
VLDAMDDGIGHLARARPGVVLVVMGTHSPVAVRDWAATLALHGVRLVDAPVSGGDVGARDASLSIMVGGATDAVEQVRNLLSAMGSTVTHVGPVGAGQVAKAANQIVVGAAMAALGEALTLAAHGGVDPATMLAVLSGGLAASRVIDVKGDKLTGRDFTPGGAASAQLKDLGFALEAGRASGVALPVTAVVDQLYAAMVGSGRGGADHSGVIQVIEDLSARQLD